MCLILMIDAFRRVHLCFFVVAAWVESSRCSFTGMSDVFRLLARTTSLHNRVSGLGL